MSKKINEMPLYAAVIINRDRIDFGVVNQNGKKILCSKYSARLDHKQVDKDTLVDHIFTGIDALKREYKKKNIFQAVGISCPGSISCDASTIITSPCFSGDNIALGKIIQKSEHIPVFIDNDVNVITIGEHWKGAGKGVRTLLCVHIAHGIGCGLVINNSIYRGASNNVGEIGHMTLDINGHYCNCGNSGCFELYASNTALIRRAKGLLKFGGDSIIFEMIDNDLDNLTHEMIFQAALKGDNFALNIVEEVCDYLGIGIANIIDILNPEMVVLSSAIPETGKYLYDNTISIIKKRAHQVSVQRLKISFSKLENDAVWPGISKMIQERLEGTNEC